MRSCMHNFKKAIQTTVVFLLVFVLMSLAFLEIYFYGANYYYQDCKVREELAGTIDCLLLGESQCCRGMIPDIFDEELGVNSYNLGSPSLTMEGRYDILSRELARNPVKTVIMEMSTNMLRESSNHNDLEGDVYYLSRLRFTDRVHYALTAMTASEIPDAYCFFMERNMDAIKKMSRGKYTTTLKNKLVFKGYKKNNNGSVSQITEYVRRYRCEAEELVYDEEDIKWLQKLVDLCKSYNVQLILCTMPISGKKLCIGSNFEEIRQYYEKFAEENDVCYYDFNLLKDRDAWYSEQTGFQDADHLSNSGAVSFSELFSGLVKKIEAGEDISDLFYDNYGEYYCRQSYWIGNVPLDQLNPYQRNLRPKSKRLGVPGQIY